MGSAIVNTLFYGKPPSVLKAACLPIIVGGVMFASLKKQAEGGYALKFDMTALQFGLLANCFAAFKGSESKKLMTEILAFLISLPVMFLTEGSKFGEFVELFKTSSDLQFNLVMSGMMFYLYNELATMTIKATGAVTASVANTAKRVIVLVHGHGHGQGPDGRAEVRRRRGHRRRAPLLGHRRPVQLEKNENEVSRLWRGGGY